jgi:hypothetical protein
MEFAMVASHRVARVRELEAQSSKLEASYTRWNSRCWRAAPIIESPRRLAGIDNEISLSQNRV